MNTLNENELTGLRGGAVQPLNGLLPAYAISPIVSWPLGLVTWDLAPPPHDG